MVIRTLVILGLLAQQMLASPCLAVCGLDVAQPACQSRESLTSSDSCCCEPNVALTCDCAADPLPQPQPAPSPQSELIKFLALPTAFLIVAAPSDLSSALACGSGSVALPLTVHDRCALLCRWVT